MKKISKILSIMLIAVLAIASINLVAIQADESKTTTITINETEADHTYNAYRIFSGDSADESKLSGVDASHMLSNIKYDESIYKTTPEPVDNIADLIKILVEGPGKISDEGGKDWTYPGYKENIPQAIKDLSGKTPTASELAKAITTAVGGDNSRVATAVAQAFAYFFESKKITAAGTSDYVTNHYEIKNLKEGYYVIIDENGGKTYDEMKDKSAVMLVVTNKDTAGGTTITPKVATKTTVKKSLSTKMNKQVAYSVDDKDQIEFTVFVDTPDDAVNYAEYGFKLIDTMTNLQYVPDSFHAYNGNTTTGTDIANHFDLTDETDTGTTLTIEHKTFGEEISGPGDTVDSKHWDQCQSVTLVYKAKLKDGAKTADANNSAVVEYADDPDEMYPLSTALTDPSNVYLFTHNLEITKQDDSGGALANANFTVQKWNGGTAKTDNDWDDLGAASTSSTNIFTWSGLGDGIYRIKESTTPSGYDTWLDGEYAYLQVKTDDDGTNNAIESPDKVTAKLYKTFDTSVGATSLSGDDDSAISAVTFTYSTTDDDGDGTIKATIKNVKGTALPETGGMGTKIFYTLGGLLATAAIVLLVVRRRMRTE